MSDLISLFNGAALPHKLWIQCFDEDLTDLLFLLLKLKKLNPYCINLAIESELSNSHQGDLFDQPDLYLVNISTLPQVKSVHNQFIKSLINHDKIIWIVSKSKPSIDIKSEHLYQFKGSDVNRLIKVFFPNQSHTLFTQEEIYSCSEIISLVRNFSLGLSDYLDVANPSIMKLVDRENYQLLFNLLTHETSTQHQKILLSSEQIYQLGYSLEMLHQASVYPNSTLDEFAFPLYIKKYFQPANIRKFINSELVSIYIQITNSLVHYDFHVAHLLILQWIESLKSYKKSLLI